MKPLRISLLLTLFFLGGYALADSKSRQPPKMDEETRQAVIRGLNAELVYIRRPFPMGTKGLTIHDGVVSPSEAEVQQLIAAYGPAVKPGDRARITNVYFKDNKIIFEINGGPKRKKKWYEHIEISGMGGSTTVQDPSADPNANPRGSFVALVFDKYVPEVHPEQLKKMLEPVFDWNAKSAAEAYMETLPPKLKDAIKNHQVLVGMNREMVTYALGRPPKKYRQDNYEEWIYGDPPAEVKFVRFVGDEVVRLEIMQVDGQKIVRTEKEIDMKPSLAQKQEQIEKAQQADNQEAQAQGNTQQTTTSKRPTLRRPGEEAPPDQTGMPRSPLPGQRPPGSDPLPPGAPPTGVPTPPGNTGSGIPPQP
jgi:outer membrane protein assembly factor BamE (lipoprotein component of BamABCDE complex)